MYVFNLLETYVAGLSLLSTVFFEAIAVSWLYGNPSSFKDRCRGPRPILNFVPRGKL
jgi:hypothetical protein